MIFSIGIFVYDPIDENGIRSFPITSRATLIKWSAVLLLVAIIIFLGALTWVRKHIYQMSIQLDDKLCTQSDFAVMIHKMEFDDDSKEGMESEVKEYFKKNFDIDPRDIVYFCPAFDIEEYV